MHPIGNWTTDYFILNGCFNHSQPTRAIEWFGLRKELVAHTLLVVVLEKATAQTCISFFSKLTYFSYRVDHFAAMPNFRYYLIADTPPPPKKKRYVCKPDIGPYNNFGPKLSLVCASSVATSWQHQNIQDIQQIQNNAWKGNSRNSVVCPGHCTTPGTHSHTSHTPPSQNAHIHNTYILF